MTSRIQYDISGSVYRRNVCLEFISTKSVTVDSGLPRDIYIHIYIYYIYIYIYIYINIVTLTFGLVIQSQTSS